MMNYPIILNPFVRKEIKVSEIEKKLIEDEKRNFIRDFDNKKKTYYYQDLKKPDPPNKFEWSWTQLKLDNFLDLLGLLFIFWGIPLFYLFEFFTNIFDYFEYRSKKNQYEIDYCKYLTMLEVVKENNKKYDQYLKDIDIALNKHMTLFKKKIGKMVNKVKNDLEKNIYDDQISKIIRPRLAETITQQGICENFFFDYLIKHFGSNDYQILRNYVLDYFYPDFILKHKLGFLIDIEIDEPYVGNTKEVIHFFDYENNYYSDQNRNDYFLSKYWIVIRFTERQIITSPNSCCYEIAYFLNENFTITIPTSLKYEERLPKERLWSKKKADEMALFNYRNTYINEELKRNFR